MALKPQAHPAKKFFALAAVLLLGALACSLVALLWPAWSRMPAAQWNTGLVSLTDADAKMYIGLWENCIYQDNTLKVNTCWNTDLDGVPTAGNDTCKAYMIGTRITTIAGCGFFFLAFLVVLMVMKKIWLPTAAKLAMVLFLLALVASGCMIAAWCCWLIVGETACRGPSVTNWNPFQGYSFSFICACVASGLGLLAAVLACAGLGLLKKNKAPAAIQSNPAPVVYPVVDASPKPDFVYPNLEPFVAPQTGFSAPTEYFKPSY